MTDEDFRQLFRPAKRAKSTATMASDDEDDDTKDKNDLFGDSSSSEEEDDDDGNENENETKNKIRSNGEDDDDEDTDDLIAAAKSQPMARKKKDGTASSATAAASKKNSKKGEKTIPDADKDDDDEYAAGLFDSSSDDESYAAPSSKKAKATTTSATGKKTLGKKRKAETTTTISKPRASIKSTKSSSDTAAGGRGKDTRSMKERMEALARKRAAAASGGGGGEEKGSNIARRKNKDGEQQPPRKKRSKENGGDGKGGGGSDGKEEDTTGYDSGDSYDSATFERTKDDDDFIDADDEDPDSLRELYAEQNFGDERPDGEDYSDDDNNKAHRQKKSSKKSSLGGGGLDKISLSDDEDEKNGSETASGALKAAVRRMQKVKKEVKKLPELEEMGIAFVKKMEEAADADDATFKTKRPGLKKLAMLQEVSDMLSKKDMIRVLLDLDLLTKCKRWIQPLSNGTLGNVTLRRRIVECTISMTGEDGINATDLKRSGYGKVIMALYTHKSETPEMKKMLRGAIEQWSRPIFQKSGNLRDLERVQNNSSTAITYEAGSSLAGMMMKSRIGGNSTAATTTSPRLSLGSDGGGRGAGEGGAKGGTLVRGKTADDLERIIASGATSARDLGNNRVRVPYSKGFQYTVRPESRRGDVSDKRNLISARGSSSASGGGIGSAADAERREALSKRMEAKSKKTNKMASRSANISIEGRAVK